MPDPLTPDELSAVKQRIDRKAENITDRRRLVATVEQMRRERDDADACIRRYEAGWEADMPCFGAEVWCWFQKDNDEPEPLTPAEVDAIRRARAVPEGEPRG